MTHWLRGLWRTRGLRWRRFTFQLAGFPRGALGIMSTLDELIENEMCEEQERPREDPPRERTPPS